jgi:hypothetical protein
MFHYFKIPYFTCTFFTKFAYNEYIGPYFFIARCSTIFANELYRAYVSITLQAIVMLSIIQQCDFLIHRPSTVECSSIY